MIDKALTMQPPLCYKVAGVSVNWKRGKGGPDQWVGTLKAHDADGKVIAGTHTIMLGQTCPLGSIHIVFDECGNGHGCWAHAYFDGHGITERDLEWATAWAYLAWKSKNNATQGD